MDNLYKRKTSYSKMCPICHCAVETIEHTLLLCPWTTPVWFGTQTVPIPTPNNVSSMANWLEQRRNQFQNGPKFFIYPLENIILTLWNIWIGINKWIFEHQPVNPTGTIIQTQSQHTEYSTPKNPTQNQAPHLNPHPISQPPNKVWKPPAQSWTKINCDAAFNLTSSAGNGGIIARDHNANITVGHAITFMAGSALVAEAITMREATGLAVNFGMSRVIFESDNLKLIDACMNKRNNGQIHNIVEDIKTNLRELEFAHCCWVPREANSVANEIAKLCCNHSLPAQWMFTPPDCLRRALVRDKRLAFETDN